MDRYFVYDPENNGFETFETLAEQAKASEEIIRSYLDNDEDGFWPEEVTGIISGIITMKATQCNVQNRPDKLEEGFDEEGQYWTDGMTHRCDYEMEPIDKNQCP